MSRPRYILTLSCTDRPGIVAAISTALFSHGGFILESAQYGDTDTGRFFLRAMFELLESAATVSKLQTALNDIAARFEMDLHLHAQANKPRLLLLVSKESHCLNDLLHRHQCGRLGADIIAVASNHDLLRPLTEWHGIPFHYLPVTAETRAEQEAAILNITQEQKIDLVVLARYMQVLSPTLVSALQGRAINIHHSFLPGFKGAKPYHQAHTRGVKLIGATAHYVSNDLDEGPIIEQEVIRVDHTHDPEELKSMGSDIESLVLTRAIQYHVEHRVFQNGLKTVIFK